MVMGPKPCVRKIEMPPGLEFKSNPVLDIWWYNLCDAAMRQYLATFHWAADPPREVYHGFYKTTTAD